MTENNAAQPGLTDDEIAAVYDASNSWDISQMFPGARAIESALLSKLRAEGVQAGDAASRDSVLKEVAGFIRGTNWIADNEPIGDLISRHVLSMSRSAAPQRNAAPALFDQKARDVAHSVAFYGPLENRAQQAAQLQCAIVEAMQWAVSQSRAALASAPVAAPIQWPTMPPSKGQSPVLFEDGYAEGWAKCMDECRRAVSLASPPVAGEAQTEGKYRRMFMAACEALAAINEKLGLDPNDGEPDAILSAIGELMDRANDAAPQASEAVRDAAIPASEDVDEPDAEAWLIEWKPGDGNTWVEADANEVRAREKAQRVNGIVTPMVRAALSAQPGAQKEQSDAN